MNLKTSTSLTLSIIIALVTIGGYAYAYDQIFGLIDRTNTLKDELRTKELRLAHEQDLTKSADTTSEDKKKLSKFFVTKDGAIDVVSIIENSASRLSLQYVTNSIDTIDVDSLATQNKDLLKLDMTVSGSWSNVLRFVGYLESLPFAVNIERAEIVENGGVWRLGVVFSIVKFK